MKLSDLLWKAANEHLWDGKGAPPLSYREAFSCCAVFDAANDALPDGAARYGDDWWPARDFLADLGCPTASLSAFSDFANGPERQGARYLWLIFAAMIAEEEGL